MFMVVRGFIALVIAVATAKTFRFLRVPAAWHEAVTRQAYVEYAALMWRMLPGEFYELVPATIVCDEQLAALQAMLEGKPDEERRRAAHQLRRLSRAVFLDAGIPLLAAEVCSARIMWRIYRSWGWTVPPAALSEE